MSELLPFLLFLQPPAKESGERRAERGRGSRGVAQEQQQIQEILLLSPLLPLPPLRPAARGRFRAGVGTWKIRPLS